VVNTENGNLYVTNQHSNTVTVIDGTKNVKIKDISVGKGPVDATIDTRMNTIYVVNSK
jgi:YVTN family beta-propeller protein